MSAAPVVRPAGEVPADALGGVAVRDLLNDSHGCRGLHQRRLRLAGGAQLAGTAGGRGETWYVITGSAVIKTERTGCVALAPGTAVWLDPDLGYACQAQRELRIPAVTVRTGSAVASPAQPVIWLADREPEITGSVPLELLGVFHPAGSPAARHVS